MAKVDDGKDPRNGEGNTPMKGGSAPGTTVLGPKTHWNPGPIPARAARSEADTSVGGRIATEYNTEM